MNEEEFEALADGGWKYEVESLRQQLAAAHAARVSAQASGIRLLDQLAAAIAACKQKDDALEKIRGHIGLYNLFSCVGSDSYDPECADLNVGKCREIAIEALAIQPDDSALKTWIGEPAGYKRLWALNGEVPAKERRENGRLAWPYKFKLLPVTEGKCLPDDVPLYSPKGLK